jgi:membrane protein implicated in regulation of membrane protease activity
LVNGDVGNTPAVIILGLVLLLLGIIIGVPILTTIGVILLIVGVVLYILGATGRAVGGRNHYW